MSIVVPPPGCVPPPPPVTPPPRGTGTSAFRNCEPMTSAMRMPATIRVVRRFVGSSWPHHCRPRAVICIAASRAAASAAATDGGTALPDVEAAGEAAVTYVGADAYPGAPPYVGADAYVGADP